MEDIFCGMETHPIICCYFCLPVSLMVLMSVWAESLYDMSYIGI